MRNEMKSVSGGDGKPTKEQLIKNIGQATAISAISFALLNITFMFFAAFILGINWVIGFFSHFDTRTFAPVAGIVPLALIVYFSWLIYRSKSSTLIKATYTTVPTAVCLVIIGISLYRWPAASFSVGLVACLSVLYYLHKTKQPWQYYYSVILVGLVLLIMSLLGIDI